MRRTDILNFAILLLPACGGGSTAPSVKPGVDCDTVARCEAPLISVNARLCPYRLTDPLCGDLYSALLQCQYTGCEGDARIDFDASAARCEGQQDAWFHCPVTRAEDGGGL
jgi:hypothetical protein